ncbi:MAG: insulinase family protein, partial [Corallincola sp.]|nr:insulinase family protein [Corallincola sp.]
AALFGHQRAGRPSGGSPESVAALSLQDVFDYYRSSYSAGAASFTVVGRLSASQWYAKLNQFGQWKRAPLTIYRPDPARFPTDTAGRVRIVNLPGSAQTAIRVVRRAMPFDVSGDYFAARIMNYPLGGAFNSRLNLNLREDKGYTYGAKSAFVGGKHSGLFQVTTDVADHAAFAAATEILRELYRYQRDGMTDAELELVRSALLQGEVLSYESPQAKARFLAEVQRYGLQPGFTRQQAERLRSMSRDELNAIAKRWLAPRDMTLILVGDGDLLRSQQRAGNPFVLAVDNQ